MRLRALLDTEALGLRLLSGEDELDRSVRGVMTTDLRDPSRYLSGGELVLTGLAWRRDASDSEPFVRLLTNAGVAGLAAGEAELGAVPDDLVEACLRNRLPLFAVNETVAFATITEHVVRQVSGERAGDLAAVVDRHRRLMTSGPAGGGPEVVLDLLTSDLDLRAWVLSPTGRQIAGAGEALPPRVGARLAGLHLAATRTGRPGPHPAEVDGTAYSLFPIRNTGRAALPVPSPDVRESVLSDWLLAVAADAGDWRPPGWTCSRASPSSSRSSGTAATPHARYAADSPRRSWSWSRRAPPPPRSPPGCGWPPRSCCRGWAPRRTGRWWWPASSGRGRTRRSRPAGPRRPCWRRSSSTRR